MSFPSNLAAALALAALVTGTLAGRDSRTTLQHPDMPTHMGPMPGPSRDTLPEPKNPYAKDRAAIGEGRRLFGWYNCSGCHGDHAGGGMGPSLRDSTWIYGGSEARIYRSIAEGRTKGMPSWGKLPPEQIWKLVAYIKSLRTSLEPDQP